MKINVMKSYVVTVALGMVILAGFILWALQWGNNCDFSFYGKNISNANTGLVILVSLIIGACLPFAIKILYKNVAAVNKSRKVSAPQ